ncbi:sulfotransferase domain-containing protein [Crateriforma conspicua]|uniref:Sulfotransferase domain protein n=2 Tax=Crateriforma conspicua TaxID=2527996 RepID=A0A5C6FM58_9PLAN|nr:Sulfotransferase domain protein [Crateriforma conspicua]
MRLLLAAYQKPLEAAEVELTDAFHSTVSESRRTYFEKLARKEDLTAATIDTLREKVQFHLANNLQPPILIKTHNANLCRNGVPMIRQEYTLGTVFVIRNPLDVVSSLADHWGVGNDQAIAMMGNSNLCIGGPRQEFVTQFLSSWSEHALSWVSQSDFPVHIVRYEDLLARTECTFRNVLTFLGWPTCDERIARAISQTRFDALQAKEELNGFTERSKKSVSGKFFRTGKAGAYIECLSQAQISAVKTRHQAVMDKFGYKAEQS